MYKYHLLDVTREIERENMFVHRACCGYRRRSNYGSLPYDIKTEKAIDEIDCGGCKRSIKYKSIKDEWYIIEKNIKKQLG